MKPVISTIGLGLCVLLILNSPRALAEIVTVEVTGVVNYVSTDGGLQLDGSVGIGTTMTGYCSYDSETPDLSPASPGVGRYSMISISMTVGNYTFTHDPMSPDPPLFMVGIVDPGYGAISEDLRFDGTVYIDGSPKTYDDITWGWTYMQLFILGTSHGEYIPTDELPDLDTWPELSVFDRRREFQTRFYGEGDNDFGIYGEVTSLTVIPEPATIFLLAFGSLVLLRKRKA